MNIVVCDDYKTIFKMKTIKLRRKVEKKKKEKKIKKISISLNSWCFVCYYLKTAILSKDLVGYKNVGFNRYRDIYLFIINLYPRRVCMCVCVW